MIAVPCSDVSFAAQINDMQNTYDDDLLQMVITIKHYAFTDGGREGSLADALVYEPKIPLGSSERSSVINIESSRK